MKTKKIDTSFIAKEAKIAEEKSKKLLKEANEIQAKVMPLIEKHEALIEEAHAHRELVISKLRIKYPDLMKEHNALRFSSNYEEAELAFVDEKDSEVRNTKGKKIDESITFSAMEKFKSFVDKNISGLIEGKQETYDLCIDYLLELMKDIDSEDKEFHDYIDSGENQEVIRGRARELVDKFLENSLAQIGAKDIKGGLA